MAGMMMSSTAARAMSPVAPGGSGTLMVVPTAPPLPRSSSIPVPGYKGDWWIDANNTRGSL